MRNMVSALLLSHGVPMLQMGDEYGHSKVGGRGLGIEVGLRTGDDFRV